MDYLLLLASAFSAATLLPGGSEIAVIALLRRGADPLTVFIVATAGNYLGALVNYGLGRWASRRTKAPAGRPAAQGRGAARARQLYEKLGPASLLLSWVPVIGDPLTAIAGFAGMPVARFTLWVIVGKAVRYAVVIAAVT